MMVCKTELLAAIEEYPILKVCFSDYLAWLCDTHSDDLDEYDLIWAIMHPAGHESLKRIEAKLNKARDVLGVSVGRFCELFGFSRDFREPDSEKIYDLLAEAFMVVDLSDLDFSSIQRIEAKVVKGVSARAADFVAHRGSDRFAIEVKSARKKLKPGEFASADDRSRPSWWREQIRKILRDKAESSVEQLNQTQKEHNCDQKVLIVVSHKLGPMFMDAEKRIEDLAAVKPGFPAIDYFGYTDDYYYYGTDNPERILFYPDLPPLK